MGAWKAGKVLWFDQDAGEGVVLDTQGNSYYLHHAAIKSSAKKKKRTAHRFRDNTPVKFTVYENAYLRQVEKLEEI